MRFIILQLSPKRWVIAQQTDYDKRKYEIITKPIKDKKMSEQVWDEITNKDTREYSPTTSEVLLD